MQDRRRMLGEIPLVAFGTNARRRLIGDPRSRLVLANMNSMWFRFAGRSPEVFQALPPIRSTVFMTLRKRINQNWDQVLLLILCAVMGGCQERRNPATAAIEFTKIPPAAQGGRERVDTVAGRVVGARAGQQIVVYARSGPWWVQPWPDKPLIPIQSDSTWTTPTHLGFEYAALLVDPGYHPPPTMDVGMRREPYIFASRKRRPRTVGPVWIVQPPAIARNCADFPIISAELKRLRRRKFRGSGALDDHDRDHRTAGRRSRKAGGPAPK